MKKIVLSLSLVSFNALAMVQHKDNKEGVRRCRKSEKVPLLVKAADSTPSHTNKEEGMSRHVQSETLPLVKVVESNVFSPLHKKKWQREIQQVAQSLKDSGVTGSKGKTLKEICIAVVAKAVPIGNSYAQLVTKAKATMPMLPEEVQEKLARKKHTMQLEWRINKSEYGGNPRVSLLMHEMGHRSDSRIDKLLKAGALVDFANSEGLTALHKAAMDGTRVVKLLEAGAEVNARTIDGYTPLHYAAREDRGVRTIEKLLEAGADIEAKAENGWTPLFLAAANGCKKEARLLIEHGANVNAKNNWSYIPLHEAVIKGNAAMVRLFLDHDADITHKTASNANPANMTAEEIAAHLHDFSDIILMLRAEPERRRRSALEGQKKAASKEQKKAKKTECQVC